jgi:hypothetical protein
MHTGTVLTILLSVMQLVSLFRFSARATPAAPAAHDAPIERQMSAGNVSSTTRSNDQVRTLALQPDGKLVVAGTSDASAQQSFALAPDVRTLCVNRRVATSLHS